MEAPQVSGYKKTNTVWLHLDKVSKAVNSQRREVTWWWPGAVGKGHRRDQVYSGWLFLGTVETSIAGLREWYAVTLITERNKNSHNNFLLWLLFRRLIMLFFFTQQLLKEILQFFKRLKNSVLDGRFELCNKFSEPKAKNCCWDPGKKGTTMTTSNTEMNQLLLNILRFFFCLRFYLFFLEREG